MNEKWQIKIEKDIQDLTVSITKLTLSLDSFIKHSKEMQDEKFSQIKDILEDHEHRIRNNTKFVYQACAVFTVASIVIGYLMRLVK